MFKDSPSEAATLPVTYSLMALQQEGIMKSLIAPQSEKTATSEITNNCVSTLPSIHQCQALSFLRL